MHELGIAESILTAVRTELAGHPGAIPVKIGLRIGDLAAVDPASLRFCFEAITMGTEWHPLTLDIETTHATDELDFAYLEVEQTETGPHDHTNPAQSKSTERESTRCR